MAKKKRIKDLSNEQLIKNDQALHDLILNFDTEVNKPFVAEIKVETDRILNEMFLRFQKYYKPPFKVGYTDGSGMDDDCGYTITDTLDEPVVMSHNLDGFISGISSRIVARVIVKLLNDAFPVP